MATSNTVKATFDVPVTPTAADDRYDWLPVTYTAEDVQIIRKLAAQYMEYATLPVQQENAKNWGRLNDLERVRPMLWHNELPWHEVDVDGELTNRTSSDFTQRIETELRRRIYLWKYMPADMVLEPVFYSPMIIENSGIGLMVSEHTAATDEGNNVVGHEFIPVIKSEEDLEKIVNPVITVNEEQTKATYNAYLEIFGDTMPVEVMGSQGFWFAPIDDVVMYMGTSELLDNVYEDPDLVHASMKRFCEAYMSALDQYEQLGAVASNNRNCRVGSGAYGYSHKLGLGKMAGMKCDQIWGACASQFFTSMSPAMQEEFCLPYEKQWLERFAYSYYGCCERLDHKMDVIGQVKNLRKISCSPWTKPEHMAEVCGRNYVLSLKPSSAVFAHDTYDEDLARRELQEKLDALKGCNFEVIIKDISTVRYDPERLWKWVAMAHDMIKHMD